MRKVARPRRALNALWTMRPMPRRRVSAVASRNSRSMTAPASGSEDGGSSLIRRRKNSICRFLAMANKPRRGGTLGRLPFTVACDNLEKGFLGEVLSVKPWQGAATEESDQPGMNFPQQLIEIVKGRTRDVFFHAKLYSNSKANRSAREGRLPQSVGPRHPRGSRLILPTAALGCQPAAPRVSISLASDLHDCGTPASKAAPR